jgi:hypothetical protein
MIGKMLGLGTFGTKDRNGRSSFSQLYIKAPMGRFFFNKFVQGMAYEKLKLEDGKDMEIYVNLKFANCG